MIAVDEKTSIPLLHTQAETYEIAVNRIESESRDLDIIDGAHLRLCPFCVPQPPQTAL